MKVLFIDNTGKMSAGAFHSMVALIDLLKIHGVESLVAVPNFADGIPFLEKKKIRYIQLKACAYTWMQRRDASLIERLKMPLKNIFVRLSAIYLAKIVRENNIDIIHENTSACYIGYYVSKIVNVKHIWHIREFMEEDFNSSMWNKEKSLSYFNESDAVVAVSNAVYCKYKKLIAPKIFKMIYNGIDEKKFVGSRKPILSDSVVKILCVGRVSEAKGQKVLVELAAMLKQKGLSFKITFAGLNAGSYYEYLLDLAQKTHVDDVIDFIGQCNDMKSCYSQNDIFCMCSRSEAFGRVTVEAMMSGCLVIGAKSGGTPELIQDGVTGYLFESQNPKSLYDKILISLDDVTKTKKIACEGQFFAKKTFAASKNAEQVYGLYKEILNRE